MSEQSASPDLQALHLHKQSAELELSYADNNSYRLSCEFLRVFSPSAEVMGHGRGQEVLQTGKKYVNIEAIEPVGNYAVQIRFNDGHDTGIFSWVYLYELCNTKAERWADYLQRLEQAGESREPQSDPIIFKS